MLYICLNEEIDGGIMIFVHLQPGAMDWHHPSAPMLVKSFPVSILNPGIGVNPDQNESRDGIIV